MPSVPIYIRQADYEKWLAIEDKPAFISKAINAESNSIKSIVVEPLKVHTSRTVQPERDTRIRNMADVVAEAVEADEKGEPDFYTDLIFESRFNKVWNTQTGEEEQEVDKEMVDELKKRGQVR